MGDGGAQRQAWGVSINTVRNQLQRILEKSGCTCQAELAALLANVAIAPKAKGAAAIGQLFRRYFAR